MKALYKLAKDIIEGGPGSQIRLDESLFEDTDKNQICLTLKNYNRPNGVATQIFDVDLSTYETAGDKQDNFVVATRFSTNSRQMSIKPMDESGPNKNIAMLKAKAMGSSS